MIKTIIKRNGKEQEFEANKLNGWGIWASEHLGNYVSWPEVVLMTVSTMPEKCSSVELQERLIKVCLDMNTHSYQLMAGRLYGALIDKIVFPNGIPTLKEQHQKLHKLGYMSHLNYSDDDYERVERIINHKRNFKLAHGSLHQIRSKYSIKDKTTNTEYETAQFVYMRMAMALAEDQPIERRLKDVKEWYNHFSLGRINCPTPNYVNLGTTLKGYASCCVYTVADDVKSLAVGDHVAYTMTYMSAGIGSHLNTRSIGDPIRNGIIRHNGKLPYYRSMVGAVTANTQNGRGGACTTHYNLYDPEVETICKLKNAKSTEDKKIRGIDYSAGANIFFARKAAKSEKVFTFNTFTAPDLYEALYSSDEKKFAEIYEKYEKRRSFKKNYIDARSILIAVLTEGFETGRSYLHFISEMNRHTPFREIIYESNLCFTGDTLVAVADGRNAITIKQLAEESKKVNKFNVYSSRHSTGKVKRWVTEIKPAVAFKTGNKKVIKLLLSDGSSFKCTPDHRLATSISGEYIEAKDSISIDLRPFYTSLGDTRKYRHINSISNGFAKQHYMMFKNENGEIPNGFHIDHIENVANDRLENLQLLSIEEHRKKTGVEFSGYNNAVHNLKNPEINKNNNCASSQMEKNGRFLGLSNRDIFDLAIKLKESEIRINHDNLIKLDSRMPKSFSKNRFGGKMKNLIEMVNSGEFKECYERIDKIKNPEVNKFNVKQIKVISIEDCGYEDVYDLTVEDNHNFNIITATKDNDYLECSGLLVHNCQEIDIPTIPYLNMEDLYSIEDHGKGEIGLCSLGGLCPSNIKSDEEYESAAYYTLLMIDKCIHMTDYALPHVGVTAKSRLSAGVGIVGLAHYMAKNKVMYSSLEGKHFIHDIAELHYYSLVKASLKLGKELGNAPWIHKTKWADGWTPLETYNRNVDEIIPNRTKYDWDELSKEIIENGGIRNSVLCAQMPTESSSKASGLPNGIYPIRDLTLIKTDNNIVTHWAAIDGEKLSEHYEIAWDIPTRDMIEVYAIIQKWTDQGISADLYCKVIGDETISSAEMLKDYFLMVKFGLKSRYYQNSKTSDGVELDIGSSNCDSGVCTL